MFSVMNRSEESWGPLAKCNDYLFYTLINNHRSDTKQKIKDFVKQQKKLKTYRVQFIKESLSEEFEVQAESDYNVSSAARDFFKKNKDTITFKEREPSKWAGGFEGFDKITWAKVRS